MAARNGDWEIRSVGIKQILILPINKHVIKEEKENLFPNFIPRVLVFRRRFFCHFKMHGECLD